MLDNKDEELVRLASYCALGLSIINLAILLMLAMMLVRGT